MSAQVLTGQGRTARRDVSVLLEDQVGAEVGRWELKDAWPKNVTYSPPTALLRRSWNSSPA